jgi:pimeloyl-ACP methyl ester carboxylesterase
MFSLLSQLIREHGPLKGKQVFQMTEDYKETLRQWPDVAASLAGQFDQPHVAESAVKFERIITDRPSNDRRDWAQIKVPTLVLANRRDPVHPYEYGEVVAKLIPGAELRELTPKSVSLEQHNADVQRHLDDFFSRHFGTQAHGGNV